MDESRRQFVAAVAAGVTGALAGCGGSAGGTPTEAEQPTESGTATATPTAAERPSDTETDVATATSTGEAAQVVSVGADGFQFAPSSFEISAGDTVRWAWDGSGHNVTPDTVPAASDWAGTAGGAGTTYGTGHTHSHTFDTPGGYSYYCAPHRSAGMTGSFTVTE